MKWYNRRNWRRWNSFSLIKCKSKLLRVKTSGAYMRLQDIYTELRRRENIDYIRSNYTILREGRILLMDERVAT
jgi:hypothetical protein